MAASVNSLLFVGCTINELKSTKINFFIDNLKLSNFEFLNLCNSKPT